MTRGYNYETLVANCERLGIPVPVIAKAFPGGDNSSTARPAEPTYGSHVGPQLITNGSYSTYVNSPGVALNPVLTLNNDVLAANRAYLQNNLDRFTGDMTVLCVVIPRRTTSGADVCAVGKWNSGGSAGTNDWFLGLNYGTGPVEYKAYFNIEIGSTATQAIDATAWTANDRLVLAGVRRGTAQEIWKNCLLVGSTTCGTGAINNVRTQIDFGAIGVGTAFNTQADYECVLIWDKALSALEIALLGLDPVRTLFSLDVPETEEEEAFSSSPHDPNIPKTVTHNFLVNSVVAIPLAGEATINSTYSKVGLGGRMMTRIGSRVYAVAVDSSKTYVVWTDDEGENWTSEQVVNWAAVGASMTQGAGSQPVLVLSRASVNKLYTYLRNSGGGWTAGATVGTGNTDGCEGFQVLYDNTLYHVIFGARKSSNNSRNVYHRTASAISSWSAAVILDDGDNDGYGADRDKALAACLDKDGDIHLAYCQHKSNLYKLRYLKRTSGTWGSVEEVEALGNDSSTQNRAVHLSITADGSKVPHFFGVKWLGGVQQVYGWSRTSGWVAQGLIAAQNADQSYPSAGVQNLDRPNVVFAGAFSDGQIHYVEKQSGLWIREVMSEDTANSKPDQVYDPFRHSAQTLEGAFVTVSGSIDVIVTTILVWGDGAYASGTASFSHSIKIAGRDKVTHALAFTQTVGLSHGYSPSVTGAFTFNQVVAFHRDLPRSVSKGLVLHQNIGLTATLAGVTTYYKALSHEMVFAAGVTRAEKSRVISISHTVSFHQVGPGLEYQQEVVTDIEFSDDNLAQGNHNRGTTTAFAVASVVFMNKTLNLSVTHGLTFASAPVRVRTWVWNSTHFDPAWAAEYESQVADFLIMGPDEAPTLAITLPKPDMDDENELFRRDQSVRRNRTGSAKTFVVPVYQTFRYNWSGFLRKRAEELRQVVGPLLGKTVRIRDHNGVWHKVKIVNTKVTAVQKSPEYVVMGLEFEKTEAVY